MHPREARSQTPTPLVYSCLPYLLLHESNVVRQYQGLMAELRLLDGRSYPAVSDLQLLPCFKAEGIRIHPCASGDETWSMDRNNATGGLL
jgi:hypothetical protein